MLEVTREDYVRTARAKGLSELAVIYVHVLKNALIPTITVVGLQFAGLLDRNPNTGHPFGLDTEMQVAEQTVYHTQKYPSHVVLPIIPKERA